MDCELLSKASHLIPKTYLSQAIQARASHTNLLKELIDKRKCPQEGWSDAAIELLLKELSLMDSNNFPHNVGVGEREARIYSGIVATRHHRFGHGIGRSGELTEVQPKAAGSSLMYKLTNALMLHIIKISGIQNVSSCVVVPIATGMTLMLCLLTVKKEKPNARFVIWPRIDQKSCFKAIGAAGFDSIVVENILEGEVLKTDVEAILDCIKTYGPSSIAAVLSTTSCFAPRGIDKIEEIAILCKEYNIHHIINNAYGLQSTKCSHHIQEAARLGRVDAFVQSTDKNLMVPVGGAVVAGFEDDFIEKLSKNYPGRACSSPIMDVFITLLSMGVSNYQSLLVQRKNLKSYLQEELASVAHGFGLRLITNKNNPISIAMTLPLDYPNITQLGSMLFVRGVSGTRVLTGKDSKTVDGHIFHGWGTHCNHFPTPYMTVAASIGITKKDVDTFMKRLQKCLSKVLSNSNGVESSLSNAAVNAHQFNPSDSLGQEDAIDDSYL